MGHVVEQRGDGTDGQARPERVDDQGQPPQAVGPVRGDTVPNADGVPHAPPGPGTDLAAVHPPGDIDPEQLRQFQQFQQFQQFLRHQEAGGGPAATGADLVSAPSASALTTQPPATQPSTPPRRRLPGWFQWLGKKILAWLIFFILLAIFATWAFNQLFGSGDDNSTEAAARLGGGTYHTEELLAKEPYEAVRKVYDAIAQEDPRTNRPLIAEACGRFDNDRGIQQRFAADTGHSDCRAAVLALHEQVSHVNDYAESIYPRWYDPSDTTVRIDSCDFDVQGGPALGVFTVTQVELGQWLITEHEPGPTSCTPPISTSPGH